MTIPTGPSGWRCRAGWLLAAGWIGAAAITAQSWPNGFVPSLAFDTSAPTLAPFMRSAVALAPGQHLVAVRGELFLTGPRLAPHAAPWFALPAEDIGFVHQDAAGIVVGGIRTGTTFRVDQHNRQVLAQFRAPVNTFDAVSLPSGAVLCSANPRWPAGGANSGLWLASPGQAPRELLSLLGPSGPLALADNGDLVIAELGPIVPPPPGAARLLRIPAARLQAAALGGTLSMADVVRIGTGFAGIYDLAHDEHDRWYVTDPAGGTVVHTAPGGLDATATLLDLGPMRFVTGLQFMPASTTPFRAYQPTADSSALLVAGSDFTTCFELHRLQPARPQATITPGLALPPGTASLQLTGGPPHGVCLWLGSLIVDQPERVVLWHDGAPLWFGLPTSAALPLGAGILDAQGLASWSLLHPGGVQGRLDLQAVVLAPAAADLGSAPVLPLLLLP